MDNQPAKSKVGEGLMPTLSIHKHAVDPATIYKVLFGKEAERDPHTGAMVHTPGPAPAAAPVGVRNGQAADPQRPV